MIVSEQNANHDQPFRDAILASPALQARLGRWEDPAAFEAEARQIAEELDLVSASVPDAAGHDPLGLSRFMPAPVTLDRWPQIGWLPTRGAPGQAEPTFDWSWFGDRPLSEPFYEDAVRRMSPRPFTRTFRTRTDLGALLAGAALEETLEPDGIIFHMSRCGSTLAAQMLAAVPHHIVASEPAPVDDVVQWALSSGEPFERQVAALRAIVAALGRNRGGRFTRFFLKTDSWHILALPLFRAAFPSTPWIFMYRQPEEVMVSQMRMPGMHFAAGIVPSLDPIDSSRVSSIEERGSLVLAHYLDAAISHFALGGGMLVNYAQLVGAMQTAIPAHFGFTPSPDEAGTMNDASHRDAKAPEQVFDDDSLRKVEGVTPAISRAVDAHLRAAFERIEAMRQASAPADVNIV